MPVALRAKVLGLNAVWPLKTSAETVARGLVKNWPYWPKNSWLPARSALTPLPTGRLRPSKGDSSTPVRTTNMELPANGLSPFRTFWLYGSTRRPRPARVGGEGQFPARADGHEIGL